MFPRLSIIGFFAIFGTVSNLCATSIPNLLKDSTAVVVGTESREVQNGNVIYFSIDVERALAGSINAGQILAVQSSPQASRRVRLTNGTGIRGMWFLNQAANGAWFCIPAAHSGNGYVLFDEFPYPVGNGSLPEALAYDDASTSLADKVMLEMASGAISRPGLIINAASGLSSAGVLRALRYLSARGSGDTSLAATAALIQQGDITALQQIQPSAAALNVRTGSGGSVISAISLFRNPDPAATAILGPIATTAANPILLRSAAAEALAAIHSVTSAPWLGTLLSDPSPSLQLIGARGLSFFANGIGIPTVQSMPTLSHLTQRQSTPYRSAETEANLGYSQGQEATFISFWTAWWGQHQELHPRN